MIFPLKPSFWGFSMAMLNSQMVLVTCSNATFPRLGMEPHSAKSRVLSIDTWPNVETHKKSRGHLGSSWNCGDKTNEMCNMRRKLPKNLENRRPPCSRYRLLCTRCRWYTQTLLPQVGKSPGYGFECTSFAICRPSQWDLSIAESNSNISRNALATKL